MVKSDGMSIDLMYRCTYKKGVSDYVMIQQ